MKTSGFFLGEILTSASMHPTGLATLLIYLSLYIRKKLDFDDLFNFFEDLPRVIKNFLLGNCFLQPLTAYLKKVPLIDLINVKDTACLIVLQIRISGIEVAIGWASTI